MWDENIDQNEFKHSLNIQKYEKIISNVLKLFAIKTGIMSLQKWDER